MHMRRSKANDHAPPAGRGGSGTRREVVWEVRPCGMLVQKRTTGGLHQGGATAGPVTSNGNIGGCPMVKVRVSHGSYQHELSVPAHSTFGELKKALVTDTGLEPHQQRLLFKGKEKDDDERLHMAGVRDGDGGAHSKVVLMEDPASKERRIREMEAEQGAGASAASRAACEAVAGVRLEVDKLAGKVSAIEMSLNRGTKVPDKDLAILIELLMVQLLKLDGIDAEGDTKMQRRYEVRRIQGIVDALDVLKAKNSNPFLTANGGAGAVSVTTKWEAFDSGFGSLNPPPPPPQQQQQCFRAPPQTTTTITQNWETFD